VNYIFIFQAINCLITAFMLVKFVQRKNIYQVIACSASLICGVMILIAIGERI